jgi:putative ABC transport system substrate-binding protein
MKFIKYLIISLSAFLLFTSCTENNTTEVIITKTKTLFLLTDMARSSDLIIGVEAMVAKNHSNVEIKYIETKAFDYKDAAYTISRLAIEYLGKDSLYFAMIVEPGGTDQRIIFENNNQLFLGPNNGVATRLINHFDLKNFYLVENSDVLGGSESKDLPATTFYKEAINSMLKDLPLSNFGSVLNNPVVFPTQENENEGESVLGEIMYIDNFGNCISNIELNNLDQFSDGDLIKVTAGGKQFFTRYGTYYSSVPVGQNVCFLNTENSLLEFAVNLDNASERYGMQAGTFIKLEKGKVKIGVLRFNSSIDSENILAGMKSSINGLGYETNRDIEYIELNAGGDTDKLPDFAKQLAQAGCDIVIPISTPAAQAAVREVGEDIPIVFTYITDPISAGLYDIRANITGLSDQTNFDDYLAFIKEIMPDLSLAGRIYNDKESNSTFAQEQILSYANYYNLTIESATAQAPDYVDIAYQKVMAKDVEAILIGSDNTIASAINILAGDCKKDSIPLFSDSFAHTEDGALASISVDYDELAKQTGELVISVLLGNNADDIEYKKFPTNIIAINETTAIGIGFAIPQEIKDKAKYIFK